MSESIQHPAFSLQPAVLILAFLLDAAIGDPRWLPHPVRIIGSAAGKIEAFLRKYFKTPLQEKLAGVLLVIFIVFHVFITIHFLIKIINGFNHLLPALIGGIIVIYLTATTIAVRELVVSARLVIDEIENGNIKNARQNLSMIVGRDTEGLSEKKVLTAAIETLAENLSDGVIAPIFYLTLGGLPAALTYKAINTMDSMIGYKNMRYMHFGWAAARLDDIVNYIPARITGLLIAAGSFFAFSSPLTVCRSLKIMFRDGSRHTSPNSGIPEAAMAGALNVRLGGPSLYGGVIIEKPYIGEEKNSGGSESVNSDEFYLKAARQAVRIVRITSVSGFIIATSILFLRSFL